jgi:ribonucleotide monophosphatase NagD (HAD superfamily)
MDGTIILENKMIDGAVHTINALIEKGKHILFVTNKTIQSNLEYVNFLNQNGITISSNQILTATTNCINYMMRELANKKFYAIAEDAFINTMIES